ncbi:alanine--tRNA ligase [Candidatus Woesearchaeota archaeon]|nr:MAG: alanine--tRNA ligase [Candidatus Woesearchaeota archaeon]
MLTDKQQKKVFKVKASKQPENYYAVEILKQEGFRRKKCKCGTYYWTTTDAKTCDDPACSGGFRFINQSPAKNKMDYIEVWKRFAELFKKWGYTPIERYPVAARWRDDTDFVQASIYDFQPYVVNGVVKPPANPLVVPQFCLRFNDIDNVGITGAHYTGFVMIGQHTFVPPEEWQQEKYFTDIHNWLKQGIGLSNEEITYHEDAWAGGGNFGPSMEFYSRGLELGNQVYMMFQQTPRGNKELKLKVLDMGMGHERNAWFTLGKATSYETTFPTVIAKLMKITDLKVNKDVMEKFLPYSSYLNIDEVDNIEKTWKFVADKINIEVDELKKTILPLQGLFSVAEHTRSLLVAINDCVLPSNVGGGYNLRVLLRRALGFIDKYKWQINLEDVARWHASYLKPLFPELTKNLDNVARILEVERKKYITTKEKSRKIVQTLIKKKIKISDEKLIELYDSNGINPEMVAEEARAEGKVISIPEDFYARVAKKHEKKEIVRVREERFDVKDLPETKLMFYEDDRVREFDTTVLDVKDNAVILDLTFFYPTSGGQDHDIGTINGRNVVDVIKQDGVVVHVLDKKPNFKKGDKVTCYIDDEHRKQLTQHHTATHIVNAAARKVLGNHINQAGAKKTIEKAHLDITHYQSISEDELKKIETEANKIVKRGIEVNKYFLARDEAERRFGMNIYQGGAVPGEKIRIVEIPEVDVEACGGTHVNNTKDVGEIKLLKSTKIQDGVVRLFFTAGRAASEKEEEESKILDEVAANLGVNAKQVPDRVEELFTKWKKAKKAIKKGKKLEESLELSSTKVYEGDALAKACEILRVQPEHLLNTVKRFLKELDEFKKKL